MVSTFVGNIPGGNFPDDELAVDSTRKPKPFDIRLEPPEWSEAQISLMTSNSVDKALGLHLCSGILARMCFRLPHDYIVLHGADNANVLPDILVLWVRSVVAG